MFINFNGAIIEADKAIISADNRGFRYGDGLFETIRVINGQVMLARYHFERLMSGLRLLQFEIPSFFTPELLSQQILQICAKNGHIGSARVRLVVFRGNGGLYDPKDHLPQYIIQSWALSFGGLLLPAETGNWVIDVFPDGRKSCDGLANLKSGNFLPYVLAAIYAGKQQVNDCLVLNSYGRVADSTIANVFYCKGGRVFTPPLSEGGVAGVTRRFLIESLPGWGFDLVEKETTLEELASAEELFLTNALKGIRAVSSFRKVSYGHQLTSAICEKLIDGNFW